MSRSETHLSQSLIKAKSMTFPVIVCSFTSSDCVYESNLQQDIGLNMAKKQTNEQVNFDSDTCNTTPKRFRKGTAKKRQDL